MPWSPAQTIRFYDPMIVVNRAGGVAVFSSQCPHMGCRINRTEGQELVCPCHGSRFNLQGDVVQGPATRGLGSLPFALDRAKASSASSWGVARRETHGHRLWRRIPRMGMLSLAAFVLCAATGVMLVPAYHIGAPLDSLALLSLKNPSGVFVRSLHYWSAQAFLVLTLAHIVDHLLQRSERRLALGFGCVWC